MVSDAGALIICAAFALTGDPAWPGRRSFFLSPLPILNAYLAKGRSPITPLSSKELPFAVALPGRTVRGHFSDRGGDRAVLYVHGFRSNANGNKAAGLAAHAARRGYSFARFDLSGHGRSDGAFSEFRLSRALEELLAVMNSLAPRRLILVGSSMGGWLSVLAAQRAPRQATGLLLLAPGFNFIQDYFGQLPAPLLAAWERQGVSTFCERYSDTEYPLHYDVIADAFPFDVLTAPQTLHCPCIIVHGADDEAVSADVSQRFIAHLDAPLKDLNIVADGDHRLQRAMPQIVATLDRLWHYTQTS